MTNTKDIERVAEAIYMVEPCEDQEHDIDGRAVGSVYQLSFADLIEGYDDYYQLLMKQAKAAIEAMQQEPDEYGLIEILLDVISDWPDISEATWEQCKMRVSMYQSKHGTAGGSDGSHKF